MATRATVCSFVANARASASRALCAISLMALTVTALPGCFPHRCGANCEPACEPSYVERPQQIDPPDTCIPAADAPNCTPEPRSLRTMEPGEAEYWDVPLEEAIHYGLTNSRVLNDVGGAVLRTPDVLQTNLSPIITQMDPRFGIEAAMSAFDAQLNYTNNFEKNDRIINNLFQAGGLTARDFQQELNVSRTELIKRNATGGAMAIRNVTEYDANNAPANLFASAWTTYYEAEIRQPLLQGAGVKFNRIAGPQAVPGVYNGVVIARANADIAQADFEIGVREYLSNLENAYWDLYYAYRDLDAKIAARDAALATWRRYEALREQDAAQGYREAQARDQYYRFEQEVKNALTGRRLEGTRAYNGSPGGTFRGTPGVYLAERRLRLLMGIPATDSRLIRPSSAPTLLQMVYAWDAARMEAVQRRPELQRQRFKVQRAELELVAARNFLKPKLDSVARYRYRGFGNDLIGTDGAPLPPSAVPPVSNFSDFDNAYKNLGTGDYQEWQVGVEFSAFLGARRAHSAVAHAEYRCAKERALLHEQERQVIHDLSNAVAEVDRAFEVAKIAYDRRFAAQENLAGLTALEEQGRTVSLDTLLDAQRRLLDADTQFHSAMVDYQLAVKNVNLEKGSLLDYHNILTSDEVLADDRETSPNGVLASVKPDGQTPNSPVEDFLASRPAPVKTVSVSDVEDDGSVAPAEDGSQPADGSGDIQAVPQDTPSREAAVDMEVLDAAPEVTAPPEESEPTPSEAASESALQETTE